MDRIFIFLNASLSLCILNVFAAPYENTIPPEILNNYEKSIVSGERPTVIKITQSMIFELRDNKNLNADIYVLDFDVDNLSSAQEDIVPNWIKKGNNILLWGKSQVSKYAILFDSNNMINASYIDDEIEFSYKTVEKIIFETHPVNTGVSVNKLIPFDRLNPFPLSGVKIESNSVIAPTKYPEKSEIIISGVTDGARFPLVGRIPYEKGNIYFASFDERSFSGADCDRWTLNFYHWMLGFPIPEDK